MVFMACLMPPGNIQAFLDGLGASFIMKAIWNVLQAVCSFDRTPIYC